MKFSVSIIASIGLIAFFCIIRWNPHGDFNFTSSVSHLRAILTAPVRVSSAPKVVDAWICDDSLFCEAPDTNALRVKAIPATNRVHVGEKFNIQVSVLNTSNLTNQISHWTCSWPENWDVSDDRISSYSLENAICTRNFFGPHPLATGEGFTNTLVIYANKTIPGGKLTFRMGFRSIKGEFTNAKLNQSRVEYYPPIWSEPVTIEVVP
jgi:hypothetical protein